MKKNHPLVGRKFNRWTILAVAGKSKCGNLIVKCRCKCGTIAKRQANGITSGGSKSCGCHRSVSMTKRNAEGTAGKKRVMLTVDGKSMTAAQHARRLGIPKHRIYHRLAAGKSMADALATTAFKRGPTKKPAK